MLILLTHEEGDLRDVTNLTLVLVLVEFKVLEVFFQRMSDNNLVVQNLLKLFDQDENKICKKR